jgi:hypothetical protein
MRRLSYPERAARQFIKGTRCSSPVEVVEKGIKPLDEWTELLAQERTAVLYVRRTALSKARRGRRSSADTAFEEFASVEVHPLDAIIAT